MSKIIEPSWDNIERNKEVSMHNALGRVQWALEDGLKAVKELQRELKSRGILGKYT